MRNDQIFVLMLVILLPMSGCFDDAVGDAEGTDDVQDEPNINPVFHIASVGSYDEQRSTYNTSTGEEETRMKYRNYVFWFSVIDIDSNILSVGLDTDLDLIIDQEFTTNNSWSDFSRHVSYGLAWSNTTMANSGSQYYVSYEEPFFCYQRFNLIALDDDGGITVVPYTMQIGNNAGCDVEIED